MFEESTFTLAPLHLMQIEVDCPRLPDKGVFPKLDGVKALEPYRLPLFTDFCGEEAFAEVYMGWSQEGLEFLVEVESPVDRMFYPAVEKGDSIELFIDTRDVKTAGTNHRFCHHFFFFPEKLDGRIGGEMTKFRTEDKHDWCDPQELVVAPKKKLRGYVVKIFIPAHCLHGYDPEQRNAIGLTYRVNRYGEHAQHFSVDSMDFPLEQQPALWATIKLVK